MKRVLISVVLVSSALAHAEAGWLVTRGRWQQGLAVSAWGGTQSFGLGVLEQRTQSASSGELTWNFHDRTAELRGDALWNVSPAVTLFAGASAHLVPEGFDGGFGPHLGATLALGGDVVAVHLSLQTGAELFFSQFSPRLPQRAGLAVTFRFGRWSLGLAGRAGVDLVPGAAFVGRGEVVLSLTGDGLQLR